MFEYNVEDFKGLFNRGEFSFLPIFKMDKNYMKLDIAFEEGDDKFYASEIDYNKGNLPSQNQTLWKVVVERTENYVLDSDIERAFIEAYANFNENLFETEELKQVAFYYLTAHYLCIDKRNIIIHHSFKGIISDMNGYVTPPGHGIYFLPYFLFEFSKFFLF